MASRSFDDMVGKMPEHLRNLKACELISPDKRGFFPITAPPSETAGIYCFYENGKPLYVGRTGNLRERVLEHRQQGNGHNIASFAFNIAKIDFSEEFKRKYPNKDIDKFGRKKLSKDPDFNAKFTAAKARVRKMSVRFVEIHDSIEQTIFEVYAHMELGTPEEFNNFDTH